MDLPAASADQEPFLFDILAEFVSSWEDILNWIESIEPFQCVNKWCLSVARGSIHKFILNHLIHLACKK